MTDTWEKFAASLAGSLDVDGGLDPEWRESFAEIPRHLFVPEFWDAGTNTWTTNDADTDWWMAQIYADTSLITQVRSSGPAESGARRATSSSSMPGIMAWMLQAIGVTAGQTVLEIGTGTGYNAGLLSHRLGEHAVTSIDIDPDLVSAARQRLSSIGYAPVLAAGDGAAGYPDSGPYDAILATAAIDHIPPAWIDQLKPGGRIVADLRGEFSGAMTILRKTGSDSVEGRCNDFDAAFMPMRSDVRYPLRHGAATPLVMNRRNPQRGTTHTDVRHISTSAALRFTAELQLGATRAELFTTADEIVLSAADESWATARLVADSDGSRAIQQGGPRRVWDSIEAAFSTWHGAGRPSLGAFGVTATTEKGDQRVWLHAPSSSISWPLPI